MTYDPDNIFAKILRQEIPCTPVADTPYTLAFNDIAPQAPVHILVIPKGAYTTYGHFIQAASPEEILDFSKTTATLIAENDLDEAGYRVISNAGAHGLQEVPHYHMHILGGRPLGRLLEKA